jgi:hypothetical protein
MPSDSAHLVRAMNTRGDSCLVWSKDYLMGRLRFRLSFSGVGL